MTTVTVVCGHVLVQSCRWGQEDAERIGPQCMVIAMSIVFTAMAFRGVQW